MVRNLLGELRGLSWPSHDTSSRGLRKLARARPVARMACARLRRGHIAVCCGSRRIVI